MDGTEPLGKVRPRPAGATYRSIRRRLVLFVLLVFAVVVVIQTMALEFAYSRLSERKSAEVAAHILNRVEATEAAWASQAFAFRSVLTFSKVLEEPDAGRRQDEFLALVAAIGAVREFARAEVRSTSGELWAHFDGWRDVSPAGPVSARDASWIPSPDGRELYRIIRVPVVLPRAQEGEVLFYWPLNEKTAQRLRTAGSHVSVRTGDGAELLQFEAGQVPGGVVRNQLKWSQVDASPSILVATAVPRVMSPATRAVAIVILAVVLATLIWWFIGRWVTRQLLQPLSALASNVRAIAADLDAPLAVREGGLLEIREIGEELARTRESLREARRQTLLAEGRFREFAGLSADLMWETDDQYRYTGLWGPMTMARGLDSYLGRTRVEIALEDGVDITDPSWKFQQDAMDQRREYRDLITSRFHRAIGRVIDVAISASPRFGPDGRFLGYRGVTKNVTAMKQLERELALANDRMLRLISASPGAIYTRRVKDGVLTFVSDGLKSQIGLDNSEVLGEADGWRARIHPEDRLEYAKAGLDVLDSGRASVRYRVRDAQGNFAWIADEMRLVEAPQVDGDAEIVGVWINVSNQVLDEERLVHFQKMQSIGELTGGLAHDFNNILGIILANLELMQALGAADSRMAAHLNTAKSAAMRGAGVTRSLLSVASQQVVSPALVDISEIVAEALPLAAAAVGSGIEIETEGAESPIYAMIDSSGLVQSLLNLVMNARDATEHNVNGRKIWLGLRQETIVEPPHDGVPPGDYACVSVRDNGAGMPPEVRERAFEPFFTTKGAGRGSGLGLAMVYGFSRQCGGTTVIESEPGRGTTVRMMVPRSGPPVRGQSAGKAVPESAIAPGEHAAVGARKVLVLDDEADLCDMACAMLSLAGYEPVAASTLDQARHMLAAERFDILFSDVTLPGDVSGLEFAEAARNQYPGLRVLMTSGYSEDLLANGTRGFPLLQKPYRMRDLTDAIGRVWEGRPGK